MLRRWFKDGIISKEFGLVTSAQSGHFEHLSRYLSIGADPNAVCKRGASALHYASQSKDLASVNALLNAGADPNVKLSSGVTPLQMAVNTNHCHIIELLLAHGADIEEPFDTDTTPLMLAAELGHKEAVKVLLAHGADLEKRKRDGRTAESMAQSCGFNDVANLLTLSDANAYISSLGGEDSDVSTAMMELVALILKSWGGQQEINVVIGWLGVPKSRWTTIEYEEFSLGFLHWVSESASSGEILSDELKSLAEVLERRILPLLARKVTPELGSVYRKFFEA